MSKKGQAPAEATDSPEVATPPGIHEITIAGIALSVPAPYAEGHVMASNEAAVLNQTYAENLRNNFAGAVKKAKAEAEAEGTEVNAAGLQIALDEYVTGYTFGVRRGGGTRVVLDPVEKETKRIAESKVKDALKAKGIKFKDMDKDNFNSIVAQVIEQNPQIRTAAESIVAARKEVGEGSLDLDI